MDELITNVRQLEPHQRLARQIGPFAVHGVIAVHLIEVPGIKYIRLIIDRHFHSEPIDPLNKTLFAFAAYNCGPARLRQLRREAVRRGLNPNVWFERRAHRG
jgi:hypothetical protein